MSLTAPYRASDLGPADDHDDVLLDEIYDDEEFQARFCADHAWEFIRLMRTSDPKLGALYASALKNAFDESRWAELKSRRDV